MRPAPKRWFRLRQPHQKADIRPGFRKTTIHISVDCENQSYFDRNAQQKSKAEPSPVCWGPLGGLWGLLGGLFGRLRAFLARLTPSEAVLGASLNRLGALLGRLRAVLEAILGVLEASWAVLGPSRGPLVQSWGELGGLLGRLGASGSRKGEKAKHIEKHNGKSTVLASRGPLGRPLGGLLGRRGGLLGRLWAIFGVLERSLDVLSPLWAVLEASWRPLGPTSRPLGPEQVTRPDARNPRGHATRPGRIGNLGSGPLNDSSGLRTEAQGMRQRT